MSTLFVLFRKLSIFTKHSCNDYILHELTYGILADISARLNLVNSTVEARISHGRFVALLYGGADRFVYFASKAYQSLTEKNNKGFCVLLFYS